MNESKCGSGLRQIPQLITSFLARSFYLLISTSTSVTVVS